MVVETSYTIFKVNRKGFVIYNCDFLAGGQLGNWQAMQHL